MRHKKLQIHHTTNKKQHPNRLQPLPQRIQKSTHQQKNVPPLPRLLPKTHPTKHRLHTRKKSETMNEEKQQKIQLKRIADSLENINEALWMIKDKIMEKKQNEQ